MLGNFDTYLLGWKDRSFSVPDHHVAVVRRVAAAGSGR
jgi:hypothetical protein